MTKSQGSGIRRARGDIDGRNGREWPNGELDLGHGRKMEITFCAAPLVAWQDSNRAGFKLVQPAHQLYFFCVAFPPGGVGGGFWSSRGRGDVTDPGFPQLAFVEGNNVAQDVLGTLLHIYVSKLECGKT